VITQKNNLGGIDMRKYFAELIGTFVLTFVACGAASFTGGYSGYLGAVGISLVFGLVFMAMTYSIGNVSGCHLNPAVSMAMFASGRMNLLDFMGYIVAQVLGGITGGFAVYGISKTFDTDTLSQYKSYGYDLVGLGTNGFGDQSAFLKINWVGALSVEIILAFVFVATFLGVTAKAEFKNVIGLVLGLALTAVHLFGITLTGTNVNPASSFGPALVKAVVGDATALSQVWVFIVGPLVGGLLAAAVYMLLNFTGKKSTIEEDVENVDLEEVTEEAEEK
jgi:aquaporin Z